MKRAHTSCPAARAGRRARRRRGPCSSAAASAPASSTGTIRASWPGRRYSRKTGRSEATTGSPALIASSTARPQPSLMDGNASTSAAAYQPGSSASGTVPSSTHVVAEPQAEPGQRGQYPLPVLAGSPGTSGRRRRPAPGGGPTARDGAAPMARIRVSLPLRGSMPPTARISGRSSRRRPRCRSAAARSRSADRKRATSTPLCTTSALVPYSSARSSCQSSLTTRTRSGSRMAWRWQSMSDGAGEVVDVVDGRDARPGVDGRRRPRPSRTRQAARARCSPGCAGWGTRPRAPPSPSASASTVAKTRSSSVGRLGGAGDDGERRRTGRKKPAAGSPSAMTRTGYPARAAPRPAPACGPPRRVA